jgi:hypothetical protein
MNKEGTRRRNRLKYQYEGKSKKAIPDEKLKIFGFHFLVSREPPLRLSLPRSSGHQLSKYMGSQRAV